MKIILASASPRRQELLQHITGHFEVCPAQVDEHALEEESTPARLAARLAKAKARQVAAARPNRTVIGCDTIVEAAGRVLGKPANEGEAVEMLGLLSGREHWVHTGLCVIAPGAKQVNTFGHTESTRVFFAPIPPQNIAAYVQTNEPYDKAGAYGIQGWAAKYIYRIEGCYYNVMGLPLASLNELLEKNGLLG